jgi:glutathione S-transferase
LIAMEERYTLVGRSSSHFTRVVRLFALELGVTHGFEIVHDLGSLSARDYAANPSLRVPILKDSERVWFGALNICRELARASTAQVRIVWPEQLETPLLANAQELTVQAMASEVEVIMSGDATAPNTPFANKRRASLESSVRWLNEHVDAVLAALPERDLSYLEATLFCLTEHLAFRQVLSTEPFERLSAFCAGFAERASARATPFLFDASRPPS